MKSDKIAGRERGHGHDGSREGACTRIIPSAKASTSSTRRMVRHTTKSLFAAGRFSRHQASVDSGNYKGVPSRVELD